MNNNNEDRTKGLSLTRLAEELERQKDAKRDFMADTDRLTIEATSESATQIAMVIGDEQFDVNWHATRQLGTKLGIPAKYVDRLAEDHPDMLAWNMNELFRREPEQRLIRIQ